MTTNAVRGVVLGVLAAVVVFEPLPAWAGDEPLIEKLNKPLDGDRIPLFGRPDVERVPVGAPIGTPFQQYRKPWLDIFRRPSSPRIGKDGVAHSFQVFFDPKDPSRIIGVSEYLPRSENPAAFIGGYNDSIIYETPPELLSNGRVKGYNYYSADHPKAQYLINEFKTRSNLQGRGIVRVEVVPGEYALYTQSCSVGGRIINGNLPLAGQKNYGINAFSVRWRSLMLTAERIVQGTSKWTPALKSFAIKGLGLGLRAFGVFSRVMGWVDAASMVIVPVGLAIKFIAHMKLNVEPKVKAMEKTRQEQMQQLLESDVAGRPGERIVISPDGKKVRLPSNVSEQLWQNYLNARNVAEMRGLPGDKKNMMILWNLLQSAIEDASDFRPNTGTPGRGPKGVGSNTGTNTDTNTDTVTKTAVEVETATALSQ